MREVLSDLSGIRKLPKLKYLSISGITTEALLSLSEDKLSLSRVEEIYSDLDLESNVRSMTRTFTFSNTAVLTFNRNYKVLKETRSTPQNLPLTDRVQRTDENFSLKMS